MKNDTSRISMIKVRGGFSDVMGIMSINKEMQIDEFDDRTRTLINNELYRTIKEIFSQCPFNNIEYLFCKELISEVFGENNITGRFEYNFEDIYLKKIQSVILFATYNEVLDIIQYISNWLTNNITNRDWDYNNLEFSNLNFLFEKEFVGYRFVDKKIVPITDKIETTAIEEACDVKFMGCKSHISKALGFLSDRETPDYKNSIKESISAVESICQIIVGDGKATLGQALKALKEKGFNIHPSLESALTKLYGYTSDKGGIRHSEGMFESDVSFEEAKYMLVTCSAFLNYLISEYGKTR
jgi:hypothetical protein